MEWELWSRRDEKGLARYVTPESKQWLALDVNRSGLAPTPEGRRTLVTAIYDALAARDIRYANEEYHPSHVLQRIRKPSQILDSQILDRPREGTCLDLAALFCGICQGYDLLPFLIVLEGHALAAHALAAVSLAHSLADWDSYRPERDWFEDRAVTDPLQFRDLLAGGTHIAVECTGFAQLEAAGNPNRRKDGTLLFKDAENEGRRHLESCGRKSRFFAIDIAVAHYRWRIDPFPVTSVLERVGQASPSLSSLVRVKEFQAVVERTPHFVGRESVIGKIDEALAIPRFPSGYVVLRGEPGMGKTALMAELLRRRNYIHHFNIAPENIRSPRQFLQNICAQLIVQYNLPYTRIEEDQLKDSGFLLRLLAEARQASGKALVFLVDALDEAEPSPKETNRLLLPRDLPEGVYCIVTMRADRQNTLLVSQRRDLYLDEKDDSNTVDVLEYIRDFIAQHAAVMPARIAAWGTNPEEFAQALLDRSEGNFMYLVYVLRDIEAGHLEKESIGDIWHLPEGLRSYYRRHWEQLAGEGEFFEKYNRPVLCLLAAVREPVDRDFIREELDLPSERIQKVLDESSQFLNPPAPGAKPLYRIYHASFQDFLREEIGLDEYVNRIADRALRKIANWPGRR